MEIFFKSLIDVGALMNEIEGVQMSPRRDILELTLVKEIDYEKFVSLKPNYCGTVLQFHKAIDITVKVSVFGIPLECPDDMVDTVMRQYGNHSGHFKVKKRVNDTLIYNGTRVFNFIDFKRNIPRNVELFGRKCRVIYDDLLIQDKITTTVENSTTNAQPATVTDTTKSGVTDNSTVNTQTCEKSTSKPVEVNKSKKKQTTKKTTKIRKREEKQKLREEEYASDSYSEPEGFSDETEEGEIRDSPEEMEVEKQKYSEKQQDRITYYQEKAGRSDSDCDNMLLGTDTIHPRHINKVAKMNNYEPNNINLLKFFTRYEKNQIMAIAVCMDFGFHSKKNGARMSGFLKKEIYEIYSKYTIDKRESIMNKMDRFVDVINVLHREKALKEQAKVIKKAKVS